MSKHVKNLREIVATSNKVVLRADLRQDQLIAAADALELAERRVKVLTKELKRAAVWAVCLHDRQAATDALAKCRILAKKKGSK